MLPPDCSHWQMVKRHHEEAEAPGSIEAWKELIEREAAESMTDPGCGKCYSCLLAEYGSDPLPPPKQDGYHDIDAICGSRGVFERWFADILRRMGPVDVNRIIIHEIKTLMLSSSPDIEEIKAALRGLVKYADVLNRSTYAEVANETRRFSGVLSPEREVFMKRFDLTDTPYPSIYDPTPPAPIGPIEAWANAYRGPYFNVAGGGIQPGQWSSVTIHPPKVKAMSAEEFLADSSDNSPVEYAKYLIKANENHYVLPDALKMAKFIIQQNIEIEAQLKTIEVLFKDKNQLTKDLAGTSHGAFMEVKAVYEQLITQINKLQQEMVAPLERAEIGKQALQRAVKMLLDAAKEAKLVDLRIPKKRTKPAF